MFVFFWDWILFINWKLIKMTNNNLHFNQKFNLVPKYTSNISKVQKIIMFILNNEILKTGSMPEITYPNHLKKKKVKNSLHRRKL